MAGYVIDRPMRTRDALEPLLAALGATAAERDGRVAVLGETAAALTLTAAAMALPDEGASVAAERRLEPSAGGGAGALHRRGGGLSDRVGDGAGDRAATAAGWTPDLPAVCDAELATAVARRALAAATRASG